MLPHIFPMNETQKRILNLIYQHPNGLTVEQLLRQLKQHGWCEESLTAEDLGLHPQDILRAPRLASNDP